MLALAASIIVIVEHKEACAVNVRLWIGVVIGFYLAESITGLFQWHCLKKNHKSSIALMGVRFLILMGLTGWLVYGNILYYSK
jgi:hypothetical protein